MSGFERARMKLAYLRKNAKDEKMHMVIDILEDLIIQVEDLQNDWEIVIDSSAGVISEIKDLDERIKRVEGKLLELGKKEGKK